MSADDTVVAKHIRAEISASDSVIRGPLNQRPPFGIEKNLAIDPIRNGLLANGGPPGIAKALSKRSLAAGDSDRPLQGRNVSFIHGHPKYTNAFVLVNNPVCVTANKGACTVLDMPTLKSKRLPAPVKNPSQRVAKPGQDGQTLGQRVAVAMAYATGRRAGVEYTEADLLRDVNRMAGEGAPLLSQQSLNAIRGNKVTRSSFTHLIAKACGVSADWLAYGIGKMTG